MSETVTNGVSALELLSIVLIVLKLLGKIDWPWTWVLAPVWVPVVTALVILLVLLVWKSKL